MPGIIATAAESPLFGSPTNPLDGTRPTLPRIG
jgi:hypothetical protein